MDTFKRLYKFNAPILTGVVVLGLLVSLVLSTVFPEPYKSERPPADYRGVTPFRPEPAKYMFAKMVSVFLFFMSFICIIANLIFSLIFLIVRGLKDSRDALFAILIILLNVCLRYLWIDLIQHVQHIR